MNTNKANTKKNIPRIITGMLLLICFTISNFQFIYAQNTDNNINPNDSSFKLVVCDGPTLPPSVSKPANYVPCDFNGVMKTVQHLINILMVLGVFVATGLFCYAGALMITGNPEKMKDARSIFPKVFTGFIIMLSAWFIVFQILDWLTSNAGFKTLLGNP